jgi:hypothetical protein
MNKIKARSVGIVTTLCVGAITPALAHQRGQYQPGIFAVNSGVQPQPGFSYANVFYDNSSDRLKGSNGQGIPVNGQFAIFVDNNVVLYVL